jgi:signal transduction histidine kinase
MYSLSFRNRIAFNYIVTSALLIASTFFLIFYSVKITVDKHINDEIYIELEKHLDDITIDSHETYLIQVDKWAARENNAVDVNPVFVEFYDNNRELIDKSPNLNNHDLELQDDQFNDKFVDANLNENPIRQIQKAILQHDKIIGYVVVAMSIDDFEIVSILKKILMVSFPIILVFLFFIARFFAGRNIKPVNLIAATANAITSDNLSTRIPLPQNKDELFLLSKKINELLDRIENAVEREKKFTSDASHELRTPLAVIKGTLEVLIRKPRTSEEYLEKINFCIKEVDRINILVDQLLLLARFENQKKTIKSEDVYLDALLLDSVSLFSNQLKEKEIIIKTELQQDCTIQSDSYLLAIIFNNLISNSIKYSKKAGQIELYLSSTSNQVYFLIKDYGVGISSEDLHKIFDSFYRSNAVNHPEIKGTGIGLSIVKRLCDLLKIDIDITSDLGIGTEVKLTFNVNNPK